ncbi:MAG: ABC transporter ATP-binding protein [Candidatus Lambdaproteobacteria bacterium]|nr:ABC transporter ATP-binding protein [Candidatus Lambdaproteobacteria bacterium]
MSTSPSSNSPLLVLEDLSKSFGGLRAVHELSFSVQAGSITSLIGGNGAGKTTVFNLITGNLGADSGHILFRGRRIDGLPPHKIARAGIARSFQDLRLFSRLSALDNVAAAIPQQRGESLLASLLGGARLKAANRENEARARGLLEQLTLAGHEESLAEQLSYGQQKLLGLGRLLATEGELLLLDEPTAGLSPGMVEDFCGRIRRLVDAGKTILLIEHNVEIVMRLSDWVVVMHQGEKIAEGVPEEVRHNVSVMHTYLGISS